MSPSESKPEPPVKHRRNESRRRLESLSMRIAGAAAGCFLIVLSVFNLSMNVFAFRQQVADGTAADGDWLTAIPLILVTAVAPLLGGFWLLFGCLAGLQKQTSPPDSNQGARTKP